jgi:hypothetical protein
MKKVSPKIALLIQEVDEFGIEDIEHSENSSENDFQDVKSKSTPSKTLLI